MKLETTEELLKTIASTRDDAEAIFKLFLRHGVEMTITEDVDKLIANRSNNDSR